MNDQEKIDAMLAVVDAWTNEGSHPAHHRNCQARLQGDWPVLYYALVALVKGLTDG